MQTDDAAAARPGPIEAPPPLDRPRLPVAPVAPPSDTLTLLAVSVTVIVALYIGRDLMVPLALGILLSFVLAPLVTRLERLRLGRVPSVLLSVLFALGLLAGVGALVGNQVVELARDLPRYEENIRAKVRDLKAAAPGGGLLERTARVVQDIGREVAPESAPADEVAAGDTPPGAAEPAPVRVTLEPSAPSPLAVLREVAGPVLGPVGTVGIVFVFVIFILLQRQDLRDRVISLAGTRDLRRTTEALDDASGRVSRYLLTNLVINVLYGIPIGIGLWLIGVPSAALWGMLATVLRFIPFLGPVIAATFPVALSIAVDPGWTLPLMTIGLFLALELFSNNVMEPWLYGTSTGLSSFAIILAAIFWTALWGPVGLLLATPLTVCLVVLGKHVRQLRFLEVLLGSQPALPVPARIYQRLLARDVEEAAGIVDAAAADAGQGSGWIYDTLLIPALILAEQDRAAGSLGAAGQAMILHGMEMLVDSVGEAEASLAATDGEAPHPHGRVLCVSTRGDLDEAAALLLADLLQGTGREAEVVPCEAVGVRSLPALRRPGVRAVVLSYLNAGTSRHPLRMVRRLDRHFGGRVPIIVAVWNQPMAVDGAAAVVSTLAEAMRVLAGPGPGDAPGAGPAA